MKEQKKCCCRKGKSSEPKETRTKTMVTPDDLGKEPKKKKGEDVSEEDVEESVMIINPDAESMDSRG